MQIQGIFEWIHVISATLLLIISLFSTGGMTLALWLGDRKLAARALRLIQLGDWTLGFPTYWLILITGLLTAWERDIPLSQPWLLAGLILFLVMGLLWLPPLIFQMKQNDALIREEGENSFSPAKILRGRARYAAFIILPIVLTVTAFYLMIAKPDLWGG